MASRYGYNGGIFRGRDDGVTVWGNVADGKLGYSVGAFEGHTFGVGSLTQSQARAAGVRSSDSLMYAARLQYDFWDAEPGYYGTGNYLGTKDILAVGLAGRYQKDGVLTAARNGNYSSYSLDFLFEKRIKGAGAPSFEAAYYNYNTGGAVRAEQGKAWLAGGAYIFEQKMGWGQLQPFARYQRFNPDAGGNVKQYDLGVNYIIDGYNAQVGAVYSKNKTAGSPNLDKFSVAMQLQF